ncbi:MAG: DUF885 domain-containing protein [Actinomycetota bacterium]|nr:DUF885 domain-containing protein [Actinomycetota bacterium]
MNSAFEIADSYVDELSELFPPLATSLGVQGRHDEWGDGWGMDGIEAGQDLARRYRAELSLHLEAPDPRQSLAAQVIVASIDEQVASFEAGDHFRDLRHLGSGFGSIRSLFDLMPTGSVEEWNNIIRRLETIEKPLDDYAARLDAGRQTRIVVAKRQVNSVADQARVLSGDDSAFDELLTKAADGGFLTERLSSAVAHAKQEAGRFSTWLLESYMPDAVDEDAVGPDVYKRSADRLVGIGIDPDEAYAWGWQEFHRLRDEMIRVGDEVIPGAGVLEVKNFLETDPGGSVNSKEELLEYVDGVLKKAVDDLAGRHFDVPDVIRPLTVNIAPPGGPLGVYYMRPSEDFSRPGGVWYAVGDQEVIPVYQHVSTAYHEGFPGHHLQIATAMHEKDNLSRAQRVLTWYPGYGEGWAMYAEVLMGELGYFDDARHYFGMLAKQMYRAARIVVDIGLHLNKPIDQTSPIAPGEDWGFDTAVEFMRVYGFRTAEQAEAEVKRYLGWPGQAIAYKLGEREILSIRAGVKSRLGSRFDLGEFHAAILRNGAMRLDLLRRTVEDRVR